MWAITHIVFEDLHWSSKCGWARGANFTMFTSAEKPRVSVPLEGYWEPLVGVHILPSDAGYTAGSGANPD
jgi:hypothetical protein